jgi:photosystem II stability/assembly factor-like uncharacterized protein
VQRTSPVQEEPESQLLTLGGQESPLTANSSSAIGAEHGRSFAGYTLTAIVLALVTFYTWLAMPQKPAPVASGKAVTSYDSLLGVTCDGRKVWVVGAFGLILSSSDAARSWKRQTGGTSKALTSVSFADARHGFAVGNGGIILGTQDGGSTWKKQVSGVKSSLLAVQAVSTVDAAAVGANGSLLVTHDGGINWRKVDLSWDKLIPDVLKTSPGVEPNLNNLFFLNRNIGWIVGEFGMVLKTSDGGRTWTTQRAGPDLPELYSVVFTDSATGWAVGQAGSLIYTADSGATFRQIDVTHEDLFSIALKGLHGIIVGNHRVFLTRDGGSTWLPGKVLAGSTWLSQVALESSSAVAVGSGGAIVNLNFQ